MENHTDYFELERPALVSLAYQMLGEKAGAQDLVQDAWVIWNKADKAKIESPSRWLRRVVSRLSIDELRSARHKREVYVGPWLPEPLIEVEQRGPSDAFSLAKECELALMWAMERLSVEERSAFILRKVFDSDYSELSAVLGKTEATCRKMVSRASKRVAQSKLKFDVAPEETGLLLQKFSEACLAMDHNEVLALLAPDVISVSDGGGRARAALRPLLGAEEVASVLLSILSKYSEGNVAEVTIINGQPAIVVSDSSSRTMVLTIGVNHEQRIKWIYIMRNPDKLNVHVV